MATLKELRKRIRSVRNTGQITKAMKMVAAAKLRRAQERAFAPRPYSQRMQRMITTLATRVSGNDNLPPLLAGRGGHTKKVEIVVCTADRGLCGSFNSGVVRAVRARVTDLRKAGFEVSFTCIGRKSNEMLRRTYGNSIRKVHTNVARHLSHGWVEREVAADLLKAYEDGVFDTCFVVYNTFKSAMTQVLTWRQLMPVLVEQGAGQGEYEGNYLFEPGEDELLEDLLPRNVTMQIYQALVESEASEHGARMTAMDNAVRNAGDMQRRLTITFNRTRQAAITRELMEIIGGAESLKG